MPEVVVSESVKGERNLEEEDLKVIADDMMPAAIDSTANLYYLFWQQVKPIGGNASSQITPVNETAEEEGPIAEEAPEEEGNAPPELIQPAIGEEPETALPQGNMTQQAPKENFFIRLIKRVLSWFK